MISIIIVFLSFVLDGILSNFLPYMIDDLSLFTPLLTIVSIFLVYPFYYHKEKNYYILSFIVGILYDLFYTNLLFFNGFMFLIIAYITVKLYRYLNIDYLKVVLYISLIIIIYESLSAGIFLLFNLVPITIYKVLYKIGHSLLLNIIYGEIIFSIIQFIPKKYKKIDIN